MAETARARQF